MLPQSTISNFLITPGTSRKVPKGGEDMAKMAAALARFEINGLIMIGGWEALEVIPSSL
mgnify:FL=1